MMTRFKLVGLSRPPEECGLYAIVRPVAGALTLTVQHADEKGDVYLVSDQVIREEAEAAKILDRLAAEMGIPAERVHFDD